MPSDNPYPGWRREKCPHCAAGLPKYPVHFVPQFHDDGSDNPPDCAAPTAEERIAELEVELVEARKDTERLDWLEMEMQREGGDLFNVRSLFRRNQPITRAAIDASMHPGGKDAR